MCDAIRSTWNDKVAKDLQGHGTAIFVNFLKAYPGEQKRFPKFASVPSGSLKDSAPVKEQALVIMTKLDKIINASDLAASVTDLAASHKARNVTLVDFKKIFPIIVDYAVANAEGDRAAWSHAMDTIGDAIAKQQ